MESVMHGHVHVRSLNVEVFPLHTRSPGYVSSNCANVKFKYSVFYRWRWFHWEYLDCLRICFNLVGGGSVKVTLIYLFFVLYGNMYINVPVYSLS